MILFSRICAFALCWVFPMQAFSIDINKNISVNFVTEANYYPFEYLDDLKQIQGFDIDIAKAVCGASNLTCKFHNQSFDSLLLTLQFGRFDAVIAALDITQERQDKVDFSDSYYKYPPVFVSATDNKEAFSIVGKFIGVQSDSSNHQYLIKHAKTSSFIISYLSSSEAFLDLSEGKIDIVFADQAVVADFLLKPDNSQAFSVKKIEAVFLEKFSSGYGIAVKKGNSALLERLNYGLKTIRENGTYQTIFNQYFNLNASAQ
jgi:arginine transport system substrate-binding protein